MISKELLAKFKKLYKDKYDIVLSDEETTELATHFLNLMEVLIKPKMKRAISNLNIPDNELSQRSNYANR